MIKTNPVDTTGKREIPPASVSWMLLPFSLLYHLICQIRFLFYRFGIFRQKRSSARVISVGNITVGGTGKTPLVIYLARKLRERNRKVAILTRGYRRKNKELIELNQETKERMNWQEVGDEPYLLANRLLDVPILVSKRRSLSAERATEKYRSEILLLDDGFQHLELFRNLDIVVIDSTDPFGNGRLLPAGILREPLTSLRRADVFVLTKTEQISGKENLIRTLQTYNPKALVVESVYRISGIVNLFEGDSIDQKTLPGKKALIFSGIGNPSSFERTVAQLNVEIVGHRAFRDHFPYREEDILRVGGEASDAGADFIITTEKDSVRIPFIKCPGIPFYVLKIDLEITSQEESFLSKAEGGKQNGDKN
jgi:tetraacyldisaccharide 4'-kinase